MKLKAILTLLVVLIIPISVYFIIDNDNLNKEVEFYEEISVSLTTHYKTQLQNLNVQQQELMNNAEVESMTLNAQYTTSLIDHGQSILGILLNDQSLSREFEEFTRRVIDNFQQFNSASTIEEKTEVNQELQQILSEYNVLLSEVEEKLDVEEI
ncbi:hypothetical protein [Jeotgalibacillus salarius]|uniref:Uncharacterized protein n=1 Tax=Jeotgalibacillus salarius TaxID=546023 RepID=A0A4Y8LI12_9BACL|nr:hypothetical protein [Jeotgalibacillus salarius]TFE00695.1 hypothetical protein E2626_12040 [Jeotgalibacillus salarius]